MAKQIIALDQTIGDAGFFNLRVVFWIPVPTNKEVPIPGLNASIYVGATAQEVSDIAAGRVLEVGRSFTFANGTNLAAMKAVLQAAYSAIVATIPTKGQYYGSFFDGTNWT